MSQNTDNTASQSQNQPVELPTPPIVTEVVVMNALPINQTPPEAPGEGTTWKFSESASNQVYFVQDSDD